MYSPGHLETGREEKNEFGMTPNESYRESRVDDDHSRSQNEEQVDYDYVLNL